MLLGVFAAVLGGIAPPVVHAAASAEPITVVVIGSAEDAALTARIAAELRALGVALDIRTVEVAPEDAADEGNRALAAGVLAIIQVDGRGGRTEVSVAPPGAGTVRLRQVLFGPPAPALDPLLAVRTVEFVRATLLGPAAAAASAQPPPQATTAPTSVAPPAGADPGVDAASPRWRVAVSSGIALATGGMGPEVVLGAHVRVRAAAWLAVEAMGFAPLTTSLTANVAGNSRSAIWLGGGGLCTRWRLLKRVAVELGAGALAVWLRTSGTASSAAAVDATDSALIAAGYARLGGEVALGRTAALRLDVMGGDTFRQLRLNFADAGNPAAWGPAFVVAVAGVELRWF